MKRRGLSDDRICRIIGSAVPGGVKSVRPSMDLRRDLGIDSVGLMSIVYVLEEQTGLDAFAHVEEFVRATSVADIIAIVRPS